VHYYFCCAEAVRYCSIAELAPLLYEDEGSVFVSVTCSAVDVLLVATVSDVLRLRHSILHTGSFKSM